MLRRLLTPGRFCSCVAWPLASRDDDGKGAHREQRGEADNEVPGRRGAARPFRHGLFRPRRGDARRPRLGIVRDWEEQIGPSGPARPTRPSAKPDLHASDSALGHDDGRCIPAARVSPGGREPGLGARSGCAEESHENAVRAEPLSPPASVGVRERPRDSKPGPRLGVERNVRRERCLDPLLPSRGKRRDAGGNRGDEQAKRNASH
jgi:hypothetical protein